ncbi:MAG: hypothetical protein KGR24_03355 [Planctomycetes bacterium]|nr:hypothetical protein [Planctomycetota bacterium]
MLGSPCNPCCGGCDAAVALETWKRLCASTVKLYITGTLPASDAAANTTNLIQSRYFPAGRDIVTGEMRQAGWYAMDQVAGVGKENAADYALNQPALFYQEKAEIGPAEYTLEPDLLPGGPTDRPRDVTSVYTYSVRFVGGDSLLSIVLAVQLATTTEPSVNALTGNRCAATVKLFVTSKRRYKMEVNVGQRLGTRAAVYQFPYSNFDGSASSSIETRGMASIAPDPTAYLTGRLSLSDDGTSRPPEPGGNSWYSSLEHNASIPWQEMLESYTEIPINAGTLTGDAQPILFKQLPHRWQNNSSAGGSREWVSSYYITNSYTYTRRSAYGTLLPDGIRYGIFLDKDQGFAQRSSTAYIGEPGAWQIAYGGIPSDLPRGAGPKAFPPVNYLSPSLPDSGAVVRDQQKALGVSSGECLIKQNPISPNGIPVAVVPEVVAGSYVTGDKIPVLVKFPDRPDIYAPIVRTSGTGQPVPVMIVSFGGANEQADYVSGSGTTTLRFEYTVRNSITTQIGRLGNLLSPNGTWGGSGLAGVWAMFMFWPDQVLDRNLATFTIPMQGVFVNPLPQATVTAGLPVPPLQSRTLFPGDIIELTITYGQAVTVIGSPTVNVRVGTTRRMGLFSHSGSQLVFRYTVTPTDNERDGIYFHSSIDNCTINYAGGGEAIRVFDSPIYVQERGAMRVIRLV